MSMLDLVVLCAWARGVYAQLGRGRAIGRCSQAVVYALWPSYHFRGNTIDKKLEMY